MATEATFKSSYRIKLLGFDVVDVKADVGLCAGDIYRFLADHGREASLAQVMRGVEREDDLIIAALGWLLREDKIDIGRRNGLMVLELK